MGGWGAAPLARSTPTLPTRAKRDVGKDTPKKYQNCHHLKSKSNLNRMQRLMHNR
ncbi:MAG: hypothetical protein NZ455_03775 [Bacteroidia bacterium]|nr:hypothetical protein [Bacteroidia bacterium]MDW8347501.1 hypothetical protein [Bacteroidia bacterium]